MKETQNILKIVEACERKRKAIRGKHGNGFDYVAIIEEWVHGMSEVPRCG